MLDAATQTRQDTATRAAQRDAASNVERSLPEEIAVTSAAPGEQSPTSNETTESWWYLPPVTQTPTSTMPTDDPLLIESTLPIDPPWACPTVEQHANL